MPLTPRVDNEWAPLELVALGRAERMLVPPTAEVVVADYLAWWARTLSVYLDRFKLGLPVPQWICSGFRRENAALEKVLSEHGAAVVRPQLVTPASDDPPGLTQVFARDPIIVVGDTVIRACQRAACQRKECRGFDPMLDELESHGARVVRMPHDSSAYLEGGDVLVDLPNAYVGFGTKATNAAGIEWLRRQLGSAVRVVPVDLADPHAFHLDTCLTLTGPGRGIIYRPALKHPLPGPLDTYTFVEVDARTYRQAGVNVLSLSPDTVVIQARHDHTLGRALRAAGYRVVGLRFGWHALAGGGFRCATHPLRRVA